MSAATRFLKPQCQDAAKSVNISGMIEIVIISIIFIMLIFAASYNNMTDPSTAEDIDKKEKYMNGLIISSAVISLILLGVGIWHVVTSGSLKKCLTSPKAM